MGNLEYKALTVTAAAAVTPLWASVSLSSFQAFLICIPCSVRAATIMHGSQLLSALSML
jgi:hypothetical protein